MDDAKPIIYTPPSIQPSGKKNGRVEGCMVMRQVEPVRVHEYDHSTDLGDSSKHSSETLEN